MSKKAICKHCIHPCKKSPAPECDKFESFSIAKAIKERNVPVLGAVRAKNAPIFD